jgi:hypothetical protein
MGVLVERIPLIIGMTQEIPAFLWRESLHHVTDSAQQAGNGVTSVWEPTRFNATGKRSNSRLAASGIWRPARFRPERSSRGRDGGGTFPRADRVAAMHVSLHRRGFP